MCAQGASGSRRLLAVKFMDRYFIPTAIVVIAMAAGAALILQHRGNNVASPNLSAPAAEGSGIVFEPREPPTTRRSEARPSSPIQDRRDDSLLAHVEHKYRYLLADVESAHVDELKRRLLEREGEASIARRENTDARVGELLSPSEFEYYRALKDSDLEQRRLDEYIGGIGTVAPVDERQQRQILDAKLRQKQRYAAALREMGFDRRVLSESERESAQVHADEALQRSLDDFLAEVSPSLTSEQLTLLKSYELIELKRELERIRQRINAR